jgi:hypothetical protein
MLAQDYGGCIEFLNARLFEAVVAIGCQLSLLRVMDCKRMIRSRLFPGSDYGNLVNASALQLQSRCPAVMLVEENCRFGRLTDD